MPGDFDAHAVSGSAWYTDGGGNTWAHIGGDMSIVAVYGYFSGLAGNAQFKMRVGALGL